MDREIRNLGHGKQNRLKSTNSPPRELDGSDGDMQLYNGRLYIKDGNKWYIFSSDQSIAESNPVFAAELDANQTGMGTSLTIVQFDTVLIDSANGFNTSDYKYHVPVDQNGYYFIGSDIVFDTSHSDYYGEIELRQTNSNGATAEVWQGFFQSEDSGEYVSLIKNAIFSAVGGDAFEVKVKVESNTLDIQYADKAIFYGFKIN